MFKKDENPRMENRNRITSTLKQMLYISCASYCLSIAKLQDDSFQCMQGPSKKGSTINAGRILYTYHCMTVIYLSTVLLTCLKSLQKLLQLVQTAAARVVTKTKRKSSIPVLKSLHQLPVSHKISFKMLVFTGCSQSQNKHDEAAFSFCTAQMWNKFPGRA